MKTIVIDKYGYVDRPEGVSHEAWNLHCNRLEQGKQSDPFEAQRTVEHVRDALAQHDWKVSTERETARIENQRLDDFFLQHPSDGCGVSGYEEHTQKQKVTHSNKNSHGSFGFLLFCIFACIVVGFIRLSF